MSKISQANLSWRFYDWQASEIFPSSDFQPRKCQYIFLSLESVLEGGKTMPQICQWNYPWLMSIMTNCNTLPLWRFFICLFSLHSFLSVFLSLSRVLLSLSITHSVTCALMDKNRALPDKNNVLEHCHFAMATEILDYYDVLYDLLANLQN